MATLSGSGGLFDFSSLFQNLNLGGTFGTTGLDLTGTGTGFSLGTNLFGTGFGTGGLNLFGTGTGGGFTLDFSNLFGGTTNNLFGSFGATGGGLDFSSLFGTGGTTFNFFS